MSSTAYEHDPYIHTEEVKAPSRTTHVEAELERQEKALAQLNDLVRLLEDRLAPISRVADDQKVAAMNEPRESLVPVAERIRQNTDAIDRTNHWLLKLTERVEV